MTTLYNMDGFLAPISLDNITETYCNRLKPIGKDYQEHVNRSTALQTVLKPLIIKTLRIRGTPEG